MPSSVVTLEAMSIDAREIVTVTVDLTSWFPPNTALTVGVPELIDRRNGLSYPGGLFGGLVAEGAVLSQTLSSLQRGAYYWLILNCSTDDGQTFAPRLPVACPDDP